VFLDNLGVPYFSEEWKLLLLQIKIVKSVAIYRGTVLKYRV
jgi:hypothetical protein